MLHVVAVPLSAQGHLNPLMRFCRVLASRGLLVTFVNIDPVHHRLAHLHTDQPAADANVYAETAGADANTLCLPADSNITMAHVPINGLDLANDFRVSLAALFDAQTTIATPLEALILDLNQRGPPVSCIISDITMTFPTQMVADKLLIPRIVFFPSCASVLLLLHHIIQGEQMSLPRALESLSRRSERKEVVCEGLPGLPTIYNTELPYFRHVMDEDENVYMWEFMRRICRVSLDRAHAFALNSFHDLEAPALMALSTKSSSSPPIYAVGPLVEPLQKKTSTSLWKEDEACISWLDQQPPLSVLYISFGSVTLLTQTQFQEILTGLISSNHCFLWVIRPDLVENVASASTHLVPQILSRSHGKGYVVDWAPQVQVLSHASVGGFLTHGGWNSTVEAIAHGVPMLCWPYVGDQFLDAKYVVEEWNVGLGFSSSKDGGGLVESSEVERVIRALMEGKEGKTARENVMRLKEASNQSLQVGGSSHESILALIKSLA